MKIFKTCNYKLPLTYGVLFKSIERELLSHNIGWERFAQYGVAMHLVILNRVGELSEDSHLLLHDLLESNRFVKTKDSKPTITKLAEHSNTEWMHRLELLVNSMMHCEVLAKRNDFGKNRLMMEHYNEIKRDMKALIRQLKLPLTIFNAQMHYQIDALTANVFMTASGDETEMELLVCKTIKVSMND